jgi:omega-3 fatty acid desaturase (delta-15 desaturase)
MFLNKNKMTGKVDYKKNIPIECFSKSLPVSLYYMIRDITIICALQYFYINHILTLEFYSQAILTVVFWLVEGFFMWCLFVVGHDCGHGSFSNYEIINDICLYICHGYLLVPPFPWSKSHKKHHLYHNNVQKDYSHPWLVNYKENFITKIPKLFGSYFGYLYAGYYDGNHFFPFGKLYNSCNEKEKKKYLLSTFWIIINVGVLIYIFGENIIFAHLVPVFMCYQWLFLVTYLQHHKIGVKSYDNDVWTFEKGAEETIDRTYGYGIDAISHNITDGHFVHHLAFTQIPHYNLKPATQALLNQGLIRPSTTSNFIYDFFEIYFTVGYDSFVHVANE